MPLNFVQSTCRTLFYHLFRDLFKILLLTERYHQNNINWHESSWVFINKGKSLIVEHLFGVKIVQLSHIHFELCVREKKKEEEQIQFFIFNFLNCEKD